MSNAVLPAREQGLCPLDAELSLPARCYSDLLREWAVYGTTDESYRESQTVLERILGLSLSVQALDRQRQGPCHVVRVQQQVGHNRP